MFGLLALLIVGSPAAQTNYPEKPIRMVVPFAAGGGADIVARLLGQKLNDAYRQPVVVDNRGGGTAITGTDVVAKAAPDDAGAPGFLGAHGVRIRYLGKSIYGMAVKAVHDGLRHLKAGGSAADLEDRSAPPELIDAVNRPEEFAQWQKKFMK